MKVLFVCLSFPFSIESSGMYMDMALEFAKNGHEVTVIAGTQGETSFKKEFGMEVLRVKSLPVLYVKNLIKKGLGMALLPYFFLRKYNKYLKGRSFDWVLMPTPPVTLIDFVRYVLRKTDAKLYLILRDIHPQSSESLGEIKRKWMVKYLYRRSDLAYKSSTVIGCMSPANIDFIKSKHLIPKNVRLEVLYNWSNFVPFCEANNVELRKKYNLEDKFIALFGGNIALGQRIENIADLAKHYLPDKSIVFVVIGKGVKKDDLQRMAREQNLSNLLFIDYMPRQDYMNFIRSVDLGLISINEHNAAPTCPSKALSYMSMKIPILAMLNRNNDYGTIIENAGAGYWSVGDDKERVYELFDKIRSNSELRKQMGENGYMFYKDNLTTEVVFNTLLAQLNK